MSDLSTRAGFAVSTFAWEEWDGGPASEGSFGRSFARRRRENLRTRHRDSPSSPGTYTPRLYRVINAARLIVLLVSSRCFFTKGRRATPPPAVRRYGFFLFFFERNDRRRRSSRCLEMFFTLQSPSPPPTVSSPSSLLLPPPVRFISFALIDRRVSDIAVDAMTTPASPK